MIIILQEDSGGAEPVFHTVGLSDYMRTPDTLFISHCDIETSKNTGIVGQWTGGNNIIAADPKFDDDTCHLSWKSPCIGTGTDSIEFCGTLYCCPCEDYDGDLRPQCCLVDIGADESLFGVGVLEPDLNLKNIEISVNPNPCNGHIWIYFIIREEGLVSCEILDISGKRAKSLMSGIKMPGTCFIKLMLRLCFS